MRRKRSTPHLDVPVPQLFNHILAECDPSSGCECAPILFGQKISAIVGAAALRVNRHKRAGIDEEDWSHTSNRARRGKEA
jgi:hypothetical protein